MIDRRSHGPHGDLRSTFRPGYDPIKIHCKDDIGLVSVEVAIDRQDGTDVERGMAAALNAREGFWVYKATQPVPLGTDVFIEVVGLDHAGHRIKMTENPIVGEG